jgi:ketosteroid isomerase-like protein
MSSTKDVVEHHLAAFAAGDAAEAAKDYTEDSVLIVPEATIKGAEGIQGAFAGFFAEGGLFHPGTYDFTMDRVEIVGEVGYIIWHAKTAAGNIPVGTDTYVVRDGKIAVQTFTMHLESA